jgi:hypothetical protein
MPVKFQRLSLALLATLSLVACSGQKDHESAAAFVDELRQSTQEQRAAAEAAEAASLPQPDADTPESSYVPLTSGHQLMFLYVANSKADVDYNRMTELLSGYTGGFDNKFLERDMRAKWRPKIDDGITLAKSHPYVSLMLTPSRVLSSKTKVTLKHYDMDQKGFPVHSMFLNGSWPATFSDNGQYELSVTNGADFAFMPVADETLARKIESFNGNYSLEPSLKVFAFVQSTKSEVVRSGLSDIRSNGILRAKIVKVQLIDSQGHTLVEQKAKD